MFDKLKQETAALKDEANTAVTAIDIVLGKMSAEQLAQAYLFVTDASLTKGSFDNMSKAINKLAPTHDVISIAGTGTNVHAVLKRVR